MKTIFIVIAAILLNSCQPKNEWKYLFDGMTFSGWRNFNSDTLVGWKIEDSCLVALGLGGDHANDIITIDQYENFELYLEWKLSPGANSGIFINAIEDTFKAIYEIAPEYQLIDDLGWTGELQEWQKTGACYAMYLPDQNKKALKPVGEFNSTKIIVKDSVVEHYLNNTKILEYTLWSDDWQNQKQSGKWKNFPAYGSAKKGHIGLQDHGNNVWFRNIKIKEL